MRDLLIKRVGYTHYQSADAFEPNRLDKYIQRRTRNQNPGGYSGGYGGSVPPVSSLTGDFYISTHTGYETGARGISLNTSSSTETAKSATVEVTTRGIYYCSLFAGSIHTGFGTASFMVTANLAKNALTLFAA